MSENKKGMSLNRDAMKILLELHETAKQILNSLDILNSRVSAIEKRIIQDSEPKEDYLIQTVEAIERLVEQKKGLPASKTEIATFMGLSESTIYFRCEKLAEIGKIKKFYGRELGFEPAKSIFYSIPQTLYDLKSVDEIENSSAKKIALALLQSQSLDEDELLSAGALSERELKEGITYLLNRGLIARKAKPDRRVFYVIPED